MLKIQMARCYPHMDNSSVLNGIITDVEKHYNKMVEVVTKIEEAITSLKVSAGGHITEISELKNICEESQERITKLESCFNESVKDLDWVVKEKKIDDPYLNSKVNHNSFGEWKASCSEIEMEKLLKEKDSLKEEIEKLVSVVHNLRKVYGGAK